MVELTDMELKRWKETLAKDGIVYDTDDDYREAISNLVGYFDVLIQMDMTQKQKQTTDNGNG
ncbi:MAG: hypothetical protein WBP26_00305 [Candidatus Saccharimonadales bacterium]